jgi:hypothetical protein
MKPWKVVALLSLPMLLFAAWRIWSIYKERHAPVAVKQQPAERQITQDDLVRPRKLYTESLKSAKHDLKGQTVWMQAGYQLEYYPYRGGAVVFSQKKGPLPSNQELQIQDIVEVPTPTNWLSRIPRGSKNIFLVVRMPGDKAEYAVPMGEVNDGNEKFRMDDLLYYDDPHKLYPYWPANIWQAIDHHQVILGMSELQTMMSVGQVQESGSTNYGTRSVTYTAGDRTVTVTFVGDKATEVE